MEPEVSTTQRRTARESIRTAAKVPKILPGVPQLFSVRSCLAIALGDRVVREAWRDSRGVAFCNGHPRIMVPRLVHPQHLVFGGRTAEEERAMAVSETIKAHA